MTAPSLIKKTLKILILALFLYDRYLVYTEIKAKESFFNRDLHHTVLKGLDVNLKQVDEAFKNHQILKYIPYVEKVVEKGMDWFTHSFNVNETLSHIGHSHPHDFTHDFSNRLIDLESKFKFYFLTAYDLLMITFLYFLFRKDSLLSNSVLLLDAGLKLIRAIVSHGLDNRLKFIDYIIYSFSNKSKGIQKIWHEIKNFANKEKFLLTDIALFGLLLILLLYIISQMLSERRFDFSRVAEEASITRKAIEQKMKQKGLQSFTEAEDIPLNKSPERVGRTKDQFSPDYTTMKTQDSEATVPKSNITIVKDIPNETENNTRSRQINNDQTKKRSRDNTPSRRRVAPPTL